VQPLRYTSSPVNDNIASTPCRPIERLWARQPTFLTRLLSMHSAAKTWSPTSFSSMLTSLDGHTARLLQRDHKYSAACPYVRPGRVRAARRRAGEGRSGSASEPRPRFDTTCSNIAAALRQGIYRFPDVWLQQPTSKSMARSPKTKLNRSSYFIMTNYIK